MCSRIHSTLFLIIHICVLGHFCISTVLKCGSLSENRTSSAIISMMNAAIICAECYDGMDSARWQSRSPECHMSAMTHVSICVRYFVMKINKVGQSDRPHF